MAHGLLARLWQVADAGLTLLFPPKCAGCGWLGQPFCDHCAQRVEPSPQPQCAQCGIPQSAPTLRCANCVRRGDTTLRLTRAAALHTSPLREAIHAFKYDNQPELAPLLARYLVATFAAPPWNTLLRPVTAVTPVPLHEARLSERGYNQAELLAASFCDRVGLSLQPAWLARTRETRQQVGLGPSERRSNVMGAFAADPAVAGHVLLLVDDVYTTGATLRACAAAARAAGASVVYGLTLAQPARQGFGSVAPAIGDADSEDADLPWWEDAAA